MAEISDDLKDNYRQLRGERGCTWSEMAAQFERDGAEAAQEVPSNVMRDQDSYAALAAWARSEAAEDPTPEPAQPKPPRRDTRQQPPARTA